MTWLYLLQTIRNMTGGIYDSLFLYITTLGEATITFWLLAFIYWCVDKEIGAFMALNVGINCTTSQWLKRFFNVPRPWIQDVRLTPVDEALSGATDASFPSGHTVRAASTWGAAGVKQRNRALRWMLIAVMLLVAFSRNYLGVHTIWDIMGALVLSIVGMIAVGLALKWTDGSVKKDLIVCGAGCLICFLPMLRYGCLTNAGYGIGFFIGWYLEKHYINFEVPTGTTKATRFIPGALGILYLQKALPATLSQLMEGKYSGFFTGVCIALFIMVIYPYFANKKNIKRGIIVLLAVLLVHGAFSAYITRRNNMIAAQQMALENVEGQAQIDEQQSADNQQSSTGEAQGTSEHLRLMDTIERDIITIGHRGYNGQYPENTLASMQGAIDIGCDYIELDVQQTADGRIVVYHDGSLDRSGDDRKVVDVTYDEFMAMDMEGEPLCDLDQLLDLVAANDSARVGRPVRIYLELKDIGQVDGYLENVLSIVDAHGMRERTLFSSFQYDYLVAYKKMDAGISTLWISSEYDINSAVDKPDADYFSLNFAKLTPEVVDAIHDAGKDIYVWTVDEVEDMHRMIDMGVDGICSNQSGRLMTQIHPEYYALWENYGGDFALPGVDGCGLPEELKHYVMQGMAMTPEYTFVAAYDKEGGKSILYALDAEKNWTATLWLPEASHCGGMAYDENHNLLWVTGPEGSVYAMDYEHVKAVIATSTDRYTLTEGLEICGAYQTDLVNHSGAKVASFMSVDGDKMYIGSYTLDMEGRLNIYDIADDGSLERAGTQQIPQKIQGLTVWTGADGSKHMVMVQGAQTDDTSLLVFDYIEPEPETGYAEKNATAAYILPEGGEQPVADGNGVWVDFESSSLPYRYSCRVANDRAYKVVLE